MSKRRAMRRESHSDLSCRKRPSEKTHTDMQAGMDEDSDKVRKGSEKARDQAALYEDLELCPVYEGSEGAWCKVVAAQQCPINIP